ncbi:hypothetical protein [Saccharothrix sp. ST-888]|uniref:hypothetical protein n=1 Tax=Saccharothrix sp. ST-888 TaxID=1427391 RepID=UPI0005ED2C52|nr:hypothetical protein [Saccharothrix sp. ST-888]KJK56117.1 hypothetical protein UK12_24565 [Saccharothrix sp. ST-888]
MHPHIEVRQVDDWAVFEFGDSTETQLAAGELVAYWVALAGPDGELEKYVWPQAERPGLDGSYDTPFNVPPGELYDMAVDMWTAHVADVGRKFTVSEGHQNEGQVVAVTEVIHEDRGTDGSWKTGFVTARPRCGSPVTYRLDQLMPTP